MFKIGAALGRIVGEALHLYFPTGVRYGGHITPIIPGEHSLGIHAPTAIVTILYFTQVAMLWLVQLRSLVP